MRQFIKTSALFVAALLTFPLSLAAQTDGPVGTIIIAHGAGPDWNAQVEKIASLAETGGPIEISYLMGPAAETHRFQDAARRLADAGVSEIVVVPLLVSSNSGHYDQIRYLTGEIDTISETMQHHLHMAGITPADVDIPIHLGKAIDDSPDAARVLAERALELAESPADQALFIIGHGPNSAEDYAAWMENLRPVADTVMAATGFRDVKVGLVRDDAPAPVRAEAVKRIREIIELQYALTGEPVVVVPVLISTGSVSKEKIPADIAGLPVVYSGEALLPHPGLADWVEARVRENSSRSVAR
ncbi:MAG TPA: CbiX/SirB N-terminal domain-containing protein [Longimicrobiaceae bacterium]|nr:CbiX/SirB N-terminal domain-containing protein [Longimicrobiaceae bacterium]